MPTTTAAPYTPEPALALQQYDEILQMVASMAQMMERSPSTFSTLDE
jgi:hypothetical protein